MHPYEIAQSALAQLKSAVHRVLAQSGDRGMSNAEIGRSLGIYAGHAGHEGHIPRTILSLMESEGVVEQNKENKRWKLVQNAESTRTLTEESE